MKTTTIPEICIERWYLEEIPGGEFALQVKTNPLDKTFDGDNKRETSFMGRLREHNVCMSPSGYLYTHPHSREEVLDAANVIDEEIRAHNQWVREENIARKRVRDDVYANISDLFGAGKEVNKAVL